MEELSNSSLISKKKKKTTTACNFQTLVKNYFFMSNDLMRDQIQSYASKRLLSVMIPEQPKAP